LPTIGFITLLPGEPLPDRQAKHQFPSEEVVRECYRDFIIARFQRQDEVAIFQRTSPIGILTRVFQLKEIFVRIPAV
jgi:hypothetical protein